MGYAATLMATGNSAETLVQVSPCVALASAGLSACDCHGVILLIVGLVMVVALNLHWRQRRLTQSTGGAVPGGAPADIRE